VFSVVFSVGLLAASAFTFSGWKLLREERKLPSERDAASGQPGSSRADAAA